MTTTIRFRTTEPGCESWVPFSRFENEMYCPGCRCNKSGDAYVPNPITEACMNDHCLCHDMDRRVV